MVVLRVITTKSEALEMMEKRGFSFIELIVVVAIMALMTGGAVVFINRFNARQRFDMSVEKTVANLKLAKNYAVTLQTPRSDKELTAVEVTFDSSQGTMTAVPYPTPDDNPGFTYFSRKVTESGINVSASSTVRFAPVTGKLLDSGHKLTNSSVDISFSSVEVGSAPKIRIDSSGRISEI